jgi:cobalt-zinc-cadmium resistance protein CzcA
MAFTVIIALAAAFILSLTFVPALIAILITGRINENENVLMRVLKRAYRPVLRKAIQFPVPVILGAILLFGVGIVLFTHLGEEFTPTFG